VLDKPVSVSLIDREGGEWDPSFTTNGSADGGINGRNGWSSVSHSTPSATDWALIDLKLFYLHAGT
jgi:hypothetical protein